MALSVISGFHFVVADFWCLWALALAIPSALARASQGVNPTNHYPLRAQGRRAFSKVMT